MATYLELHQLWNDVDPATGNPLSDSLRAKLTIAVMIEAEAINQQATPDPNHVKWAARALALPETEGIRMLGAVLASNNGLTVAQIIAATDAQIQAKVALAVDLVATGSA